MKKLVYLDHGATSFPKAPGVSEAVRRFLDEVGANPGRSGHRLSTAAARIVYRCREALAGLFDAPRSDRIVFTHNVTHAINLVLHSFLRPSDHVVTSVFEHNALARPLRHLEDILGLEVTRIETSMNGLVDPDVLRDAIRPETRLVALLHGSNVTGAVRDLHSLLDACGGTPLLLDAAQTAGAIPISLKESPVAFFCFTGHKGLLGPPGTGGVYVGESFRLEPFICGGTGSRSEDEHQPDFLPDSHESGTLNTAGIAGLLAAVEWLTGMGIHEVSARERRICRLMWERLEGIGGLVIHGPSRNESPYRLPTLSIEMQGLEPGELALRLDRQYGICTRVGLHCAPSAHRRMGTWPRGTVRVSAGPFTEDTHIEHLAMALEEIASSVS